MVSKKSKKVDDVGQGLDTLILKWTINRKKLNKNEFKFPRLGAVDKRLLLLDGEGVSRILDSPYNKFNV